MCNEIFDSFDNISVEEIYGEIAEAYLENELSEGKINVKTNVTTSL